MHTLFKIELSVRRIMPVSGSLLALFLMQHKIFIQKGEAYLCLANHFGVCFELEAEEPGCGIYINTDINGAYRTNQYKAYLSERPEDSSLDMLFDNAHGDTDFYFSSDKELLQWFRECGGITADSIETLRETLDCEYVSIHEFVNPY